MEANLASSLGQWKNTLKASQIADGMNAASCNACRLLDDAITLFDLERYPSAISLAILSIEESGKIGILRELALARDGKDVKEAWKAYRSHTKKNVMWLFPALASGGVDKLDGFKMLFSESSDHTSILDDLKQIGFYTDCLGKAHWSIPAEIIDKNNTEEIIQIAKVLAKDERYTNREIELWIKHLKPVWKGNMGSMKDALNNWFNEMVDEGLQVEGKQSFSSFIDI